MSTGQQWHSFWARVLWGVGRGCELTEEPSNTWTGTLVLTVSAWVHGEQDPWDLVRNPNSHPVTAEVERVRQGLMTRFLTNAQGIQVRVKNWDLQNSVVIWGSRSQWAHWILYIDSQTSCNVYGISICSFLEVVLGLSYFKKDLKLNNCSGISFVF